MPPIKDGKTKHQITIKNWSKHQREMRGGENRKRRRDWVAVSTDICHDPDIINLTIEQRWLWIALLCHAGAVGPVFKLSASDARVLFRLRRNADFQSLQNQGLIEIKTDTLQDKTRQDKTVTLPPVELPVPKQKNASVPALTKPENLCIEAWDCYIKNRREMKLKKLTPTGMKRQMNHLAKFTQEVQMAAVVESVRNGWQGIFPDKVKTSESNFDKNRQAIQDWLNDETSDRRETDVLEPDAQGVRSLPSGTTKQGSDVDVLADTPSAQHGSG